VGLAELGRKLARGEALVAGVLSGTSGDGIDVALVRFGALREGRLPPPRMEAFATLPFPAEVAPRVRAALDGEPLAQRDVALLSRDLGRAFGRAARELAQARGLELDLAGSHGQTVWHHDGIDPGGRASLQLGDGDFAAEEAGCAVVSDFRQRDLAAGGEGAPISVYADDLVFAELPRPAAVLNLGGMANLSILPEPGRGERLAFDTGPAGSLLDGLARALLGAPYDEGGARARAGRADERLVRELLEHPFLRRAPPKSTGRDTFGPAWVESVIARARELGVLADPSLPDDLLASAAEFVARHAVLGLREHGGPGLTWLVACGGGARNAALLEALARLAPQPLASAEDFGVDPDAREALVFAVLAARCVLGEALTHPSATGAREGRVLGKISPPLTSQTGST